MRNLVVIGSNQCFKPIDAFIEFIVFILNFCKILIQIALFPQKISDIALSFVTSLSDTFRLLFDGITFFLLFINFFFEL